MVLNGHMGGGAGAERGHADPAGIGLGVGDEFRDGPGRNRRTDDHHQRKIDEARHRGDVADEIERQVVEQRDVHRRGCRNIQERVAVGRRTDRRLDRNIGGGAGLVLDDDGLAEPRREPLRHDPRHRVRPAAGRKSDDPAQRPGRIFERRRAVRKDGNRRSGARELQKSAAR
jgi:hypothetical protein